MTTLREVITRFRLETNERDYSNFNQKLSTMKGGLRSLATAFGVTLGVGGVIAISRMGLSAERARFDLERLAGVNFGRVREVLGSVSSELETIRGGASNIFRPRQFDEAAANFVKVFGTGKRELDAFGRIFSFAAKQSALTGDNVVEITKAIQDAVSGGGFDALLNIPGFTQYRKQLLEFQQEAMNPGEPGGAVGMQNRMRAILRIINESSDEQARAMKKVPAELLAADKTANKMQETLEKLGSVITKTLVPALEKLVKLLDAIVGKFVDINEKAAKAGVSPGVYAMGEAYAGLGDIVKNPGKLAPDMSAMIGPDLPKREGQFPVEGFADRMRYLGWLPPFKTGTMPEQKTEINITNEFNIRSTDPTEAAREAFRKFNDKMNEARASVPPTERR